MTTNAERAKWAEAAAKEFTVQVGGRVDDPDTISDLICDLLHFAQAQGHDAMALARRGVAMWHAESLDPEGEPRANDEVEISYPPPAQPTHNRRPVRDMMMDADREMHLLRRIVALLIERERLSNTLSSIIAGAPEKDPGSNWDGWGYVSESPDDNFHHGERREHWRIAQIAQKALTELKPSVPTT